jgi:hypothetical protein
VAGWSVAGWSVAGWSAVSAAADVRRRRRVAFTGAASVSATDSVVVAAGSSPDMSGLAVTVAFVALRLVRRGAACSAAGPVWLSSVPGAVLAAAPGSLSSIRTFSSSGTPGRV